jgi:hypothetical protein
MGRAMTAADTCRRYAAECIEMSQRSRNDGEKPTLVEMAAMWLRLADFADKHEADPSAVLPKEKAALTTK